LHSTRWPGFEIVFLYRATRYEILIENPEGVSRGVAYAELDGQSLTEGPTVIALVDDGQTHRVRMILGEHSRSAQSDAAM
jgi:cyclic beta-1,2-glucan synthetase